MVDDNIGVQETNIYNRNQVLNQIDNLLQIADETERQKKISEFIEDRVNLLTSTATPREFSLLSSPRKGFLHPESEVRRNGLVDPFLVNDLEIYRELIDSLGEFKSSPAWSSRSLREIVPYAVLRAIGNYFGNRWSTTHTESRNRTFYMNRLSSGSTGIDLRELKGQGIAVCAEKGTVAQNLLSFLGYESELVASTKCRLEFPEQDDESGHVYLVITKGEEHLIYDPTNPTMVKNADGSVYTVMPSSYPINNEQYKTLTSGGQVEVTHNDGSWDGQQMIKGLDQKRIYGGPSQAA